jgi:hypothetical protein
MMRSDACMKRITGGVMKERELHDGRRTWRRL